MKKCYIIKKNKEIKKILDCGRRYKSKNFIIYIINANTCSKNNKLNNIDTSKVAFLVSKKLGNSPQRNKAKRKLRISIRNYWKNIINKKIYIVMLAQNNILVTKQENLNLELETVLKNNFRF